MHIARHNIIMHKNPSIKIAGILIIILFLVGCTNTELTSSPVPTEVATQTSSPESSTNWPTEGWLSSTPEERGMDSSILADMIESIQEEDHNIHSVNIIRNGSLVLDIYFYPFRQDLKHTIHSCTKSITSALVGIAIDEGLIESVDQSILEFFPDKIAANSETNKSDISLEDLLTMSSGLDCRDSYLYDWQGLIAMMASDDWVQYMLDLPMADQPGARFEYCNGGSYLLSAIVQQASGMTALDFATQHLFQPLGITDVEWPASPQGINLGWGDMSLKPLDMAKFGYLYLNQGRWGDEQILAPEWVHESTSAQISTGTLSDSYGYQWWIDKDNYVMALGFAGQIIFVLPEQDMVVVFTSGLAHYDFFVPERLLNEYILPALISSDPLPENQSDFMRLKSLIKTAQEPDDAEKIPALPGSALDVSGKTYVFEEGPPFKEFSLIFSEDIARFHLTWSKTIEVDVGLDNIFRLTESAGYVRAYKGFWLDDNTFHIDYEIVGYSEIGSWEISFENDQAVARYQENTTGTSDTLLAYRKEDE
jgi:CubicO group peptidase (beta-lactamase class C family)